METPRKFITAKLSIRKPGSSSMLIICDLFNSHALFIYKSVVICWLASFEIARYLARAYVGEPMDATMPTYALAKYLAEILKPVVGKTEHHVVNSRDL